MQITRNWRECLPRYILFVQYHGCDMEITPNQALGFPDVVRQGVSFIFSYVVRRSGKSQVLIPMFADKSDIHINCSSCHYSFFLKPYRH